VGDISGSVALVTGAAQGIGRAIALRLARDGADVAVVDLNGDKAATVADEIAALGRKGTSIQADVSDRDQVFAAVERTRSELGSLDIMVNNAGIVQVEPLLDVTPEKLDAIVGVNLKGVVWGIQAAAVTFREHGTKGAIVNASSIAGHDGFAMLSAYCATKFAVRALTQSAAKELAADGITVNAYCPGVVDTDMWVSVDAEFAKHTGAEIGATFDQFVGTIALGRAETPDDVAGFVSYLAGPDGRYMTGQSVLIDGGMVYR
jgi:meso-butanediol dehydrogenase / (S,S)-butanediol dehydrogenase / diacetyl reductase